MEVTTMKSVVLILSIVFMVSLPFGGNAEDVDSILEAGIRLLNKHGYSYSPTKPSTTTTTRSPSTNPEVRIKVYRRLETATPEINQTNIFPLMTTYNPWLRGMEYYDKSTGTFTSPVTSEYYVTLRLNGYCNAGSRLVVGMIKNSEDILFTLSVGREHLMYTITTYHSPSSRFTYPTKITLLQGDTLKVKVLDAHKAGDCIITNGVFGIRRPKTY